MWEGGQDGDRMWTLKLASRRGISQPRFEIEIRHGGLLIRGLAIAALRLLGLDGSLVHQHNGDVVLHRVYPMALLAFQALGILAVLERLLARRTDQDFQQVLGNHHKSIVLKINSTRRHGGTEKRALVF